MHKPFLLGKAGPLGADGAVRSDAEHDQRVLVVCPVGGKARKFLAPALACAARRQISRFVLADLRPVDDAVEDRGALGFRDRRAGAAVGHDLQKQLKVRPLAERDHRHRAGRGLLPDALVARMAAEMLKAAA